jgi:hypothetical protein
MTPVSPDTAAAEPDKIRAPFTDRQQVALYRWQHATGFHPFTCPNGHGPLTVDERWKCLECDYTQDWAHAFMADTAAPASAAVPPATTADMIHVVAEAIDGSDLSARLGYFGIHQAAKVAVDGLIESGHLAGSAVPAVPPDTECARLVRHWALGADAEDSVPWRCRLNRDHYGACSPHRAGYVEAVPDPPSAPDEGYVIAGPQPGNPHRMECDWDGEVHTTLPSALAARDECRAAGYPDWDAYALVRVSPARSVSSGDDTTEEEK